MLKHPGLNDSHPMFTEHYHFVNHHYRYYVERIPPEGIIIRLPKRYQAAHYFWSWVWILSILGCIALVFIRWWLVFSVFIIPGIIRSAVSTSIKQFVLEYAEEDEDFFNLCWENGIIKRL